MNKIKEKQNSKEILDALYAQRTIYSEAGMLDNITFFLTFIIVGIPIICEVYGLDELLIQTITFILSCGCNIIEFVGSKKFMIAATIQEYVDQKIYNIKKIGNKIKDLSVISIKEYVYKQINKNEVKYQKQIKSAGDEKEHGVRDWYFVDAKANKLEAIFECQKQNVWWDKQNINSYLKVLSISATIMLITTMIFFWDNIATVLIIFFGIAPYFTNKITKILKYFSISKQLDTLINYVDKKEKCTEEDLNEIQEKIFNRREISFKVPDFIHNLQASKLHNMFNYMNTKGE